MRKAILLQVFAGARTPKYADGHARFGGRSHETILLTSAAV